MVTLVGGRSGTRYLLLLTLTCSASAAPPLLRHRLDNVVPSLAPPSFSSALPPAAAARAALASLSLRCATRLPSSFLLRFAAFQRFPHTALWRPRLLAICASAPPLSLSHAPPAPHASRSRRSPQAPSSLSTASLPRPPQPTSPAPRVWARSLSTAAPPPPRSCPSPLPPPRRRCERPARCAAARHETQHLHLAPPQPLPLPLPPLRFEQPPPPRSLAPASHPPPPLAAAPPPPPAFHCVSLLPRAAGGSGRAALRASSTGSLRFVSSRSSIGSIPDIHSHYGSHAMPVAGSCCIAPPPPTGSPLRVGHIWPA